MLKAHLVKIARGLNWRDKRRPIGLPSDDEFRRSFIVAFRLLIGLSSELENWFGSDCNGVVLIIAALVPMKQLSCRSES